METIKGNYQNNNTIYFELNDYNGGYKMRTITTINHLEETAKFYAFGSTCEEINDKIFTYFKWLNQHFTILNAKNGLFYTQSDFQRLKKIKKLDVIREIFCMEKKLSELLFFNHPDTKDPEYIEDPNFDRVITFRYQGNQVTFPVSLSPNNENNFDDVINLENKINERSLYKTERLYLKYLEKGSEILIASNTDLREAIDNKRDILASPVLSSSTRKQINPNTLLLVVIISIGIFAGLMRLYHRYT